VGNREESHRGISTQSKHLSRTVDARLRKEFETVTLEIVEGCIKEATTSLEKLHEFITKKDKEDEESSDEGSTDPEGANELSRDGEETSGV